MKNNKFILISMIAFAFSIIAWAGMLSHIMTGDSITLYPLYIGCIGGVVCIFLMGINLDR